MYTWEQNRKPRQPDAYAKREKNQFTSTNFLMSKRSFRQQTAKLFSHMCAVGPCYFRSRFLHLVDSSLASLPAEVLVVLHAAAMLTCSVSQAPAAVPSCCNAFPQPLPAPGKTPQSFQKSTYSLIFFLRPLLNLRSHTYNAQLHPVHLCLPPSPVGKMLQAMG